MAITLIGKDFKAFYDDPSVFPEDAYHDDAVIYVDGELFMADIEEPAPKWKDAEVKDIPDNARVKVESGIIIVGTNGTDLDMVTAVRRWLKKRDTVTLIVSVPNRKLEAVTKAIKAAGGQVET